MLVQTKIDIGHTHISKRLDGLVLIEASNRIYSVNDIKDIHRAVKEINFGEKVLMLLIADEYTSIDNSARQFLSTPEAGEQSIAEAYVIKSLAQRLLLNFLIRVNGTPVPAKFFTDIKEAEHWLKSFHNKQTDSKKEKVLQSQ